MYGHSATCDNVPRGNATAAMTANATATHDNSSCDNASAAYWVYIISYCLANTMYFVLILFADGAVYLVILLTLTVPLGSIFLDFFQIDNHPHFKGDKFSHCTDWYRYVGVVIIVGAVIGYFLFSRRKESEDQTQNMEGL